MFKIGDRVGAILGTDKGDEVIDFLGYGNYDGEHAPVEAVGFMADCINDANKKAPEIIKNPRIKLDSGSIVYGCECWWGGADAVKKHLEGKTVKLVDIDQVREEYKNDQSNS